MSLLFLSSKREAKSYTTRINTLLCVIYLVYTNYRACACCAGALNYTVVGKRNTKKNNVLKRVPSPERFVVCASYKQYEVKQGRACLQAPACAPVPAFLFH